MGLTKKYIRWPLIAIIVIVVIGLFHTAGSLDLQEVVKVYDADTIEIRDGTKIRLIGVDAPEVESPYRQAESYGVESKSYLTKMLLGKKVRIVVGEQPYDKYGRTLAFIYLDDTLINGRIIKDGWARAYRYYDFPFKELFITYEKQARAKGLGMWEE
ncbi:MAG: thermonuclease family protein [Deltaproteobacteria bacterium]|nr:thermonuclease family protein [Deltaproteobacteria bacterium]